MLSPELLRYYPFFAGLTNPQLSSIAMLATEETYPAGTILCEKGQPAETLYFLVDGCVDLYYPSDKISSSDFPQGIPIGEVNAGEPFSISALIEPYRLTSTAKVGRSSRVIEIEARSLRGLFRKDKRLAYLLTKQAAQAVRARLETTRVQLAAALA